LKFIKYNSYFMNMKYILMHYIAVMIYKKNIINNIKCVF